MISITINGLNLDFQLEREKTVSDIMVQLEQFCNQQHNAIFAIACNGEELSAEKLDDFFKLPVTEDLKIEILTKSAEDITNEIKDLGNQFSQIAFQLENVPVLMQSAKESEVYATIESTSNVFSLLCRYLTLADVSGVSVKTKLNDKTIEDYQKDISNYLSELINSLEDKDIVSTGDIAEYELAPLVKELSSALSSL